MEQNTRLCLVPLLNIYQYKTTSLPMLVVALSWEVDWASIGSRRLLRTEDRLLFQVKEGRESRSKRREERWEEEQEEEEKLERRSKIWRRRKSEIRGRSRRIPPPTDQINIFQLPRPSPHTESSDGTMGISPDLKTI